MSSAVVRIPAGATVRRGLGEWLRACALLVRWYVLSLRLMLPMLVAVQLLVGAGSVLAVSLWFDVVPPGAGLFVTTGGATISLLQVGLVMGPQLVADQRLRGTDDFLWSLPAPRTAWAAAWLVLNAMVTVPALAATLALGRAVFDLDLAITPALVPAVGLTVLTGTMLGYAIAYGVRNPTLVQVLTQLFVFGIFGFTPLLFPERNLPHWLSSLHRWLPLEGMGDLIRASVTRGVVDDVGRSWVLVVVWGVACTVVGVRVAGRRA